MLQKYLPQKVFIGIFMDTIIDLSKDPIDSVRAKFANILPKIRKGFDRNDTFLAKILSDNMNRLLLDDCDKVSFTASDS